MKVTQGLIDGVILLTKLQPKGKVSFIDNSVTFYIRIEEYEFISEKEEQLLDDWGWILTDEKELVTWLYY